VGGAERRSGAVLAPSAQQCPDRMEREIHITWILCKMQGGDAAGCWIIAIFSKKFRQIEPRSLRIQ
jgi:hypothetical protein